MSVYVIEIAVHVMEKSYQYFSEYQNIDTSSIWTLGILNMLLFQQSSTENKQLLSLYIFMVRYPFPINAILP